MISRKISFLALLAAISEALNSTTVLKTLSTLSFSLPIQSSAVSAAQPCIVARIHDGFQTLANKECLAVAWRNPPINERYPHRAETVTSSEGVLVSRNKKTPRPIWRWGFAWL